MLWIRTRIARFLCLWVLGDAGLGWDLLVGRLDGIFWLECWGWEIRMEEVKYTYVEGQENCVRQRPVSRDQKRRDFQFVG